MGLPTVPAYVGLPVGVFLTGAGTIGALWSTVTLYLCGGGLPIAVLPPTRLVKEGPYGVSRHPLYLSFLLYLIGWAGIGGSPSAAAIVLFIALIVGLYTVFYEEPVLIRRFGDEYRRYKDEVPFVFRRRDASGPGILYSISYIIGKPLVRIFFPIKILGEENLPQAGPLLLIANHASYLDSILLIAAANRYIRFLTTGEMLRTRFGRWFFLRTGSIPTNRYRVDPASVRGFFSALTRKAIVGLFPEGERTWDGQPLSVPPTVKRLLRRAGVPIVAVRITGSYAVYPRWAVYPLPGPITVEFFPPVGSDEVEKALARIAVESDGKTWFPRSARGIELVLWACPVCNTIGSIKPRRRRVSCTNCGEVWYLDRRMRLWDSANKPSTLAALASAIPADDILEQLDELVSIGSVEVYSGKDKLTRLAIGEAVYRQFAIHVGKRAFPLATARIIRLEGKDRLDIGFINGERLRLRFLRDSPLKWACFLRLRLGTDKAGSSLELKQ